MVKLIGLISRNEGLSREEFVRYWIETHAPMVYESPLVRRYSLNFTIAEPSRPDVPSMGITGMVDAISEMWFDDAEAYNAFRASDAARRWFADGASRMGKSQTFMVEEKVIVP